MLGEYLLRRDIRLLIYSAEQALSKRSIEQLPDSCLKDIKEAGRCLAFDLPTACGFHIFRALETVILMYFPALRINLPSKKLRNLGVFIALLEGRDIKKKGRPIVAGAPKADEKITGMLTHLKDFYRNPLMHPEITLEDDEAISTFQFAISAIDIMVHDIIQRNSANAVQVSQ